MLFIFVNISSSKQFFFNYYLHETVNHQHFELGSLSFILSYFIICTVIY